MRIGDEPLEPAAVAAAARGGAMEVELTGAARERIASAHRAAVAAAERRPVYGRTTGVGANRSVGVEAGDERAHSLRLLLQVCGYEVSVGSLGSCCGDQECIPANTRRSR